MRSGALKHGEKAYGHRFLKPGFSFSEQTDLAFALGFPSLTFVVDGHPDDDDPLGKMSEWRVYDQAWLPATIALYLVRDQAYGHQVVRGSASEWLETRHQPLTPEEMRRLLPWCIEEMFSVYALYRLEALTSTDTVLEMLMPELQRIVANNDVERLDNTSVIGVVKAGVPLLLLRVPEALRKEHRKKLVELSDRIGDLPRMRRAFDIALDRGTDNEPERWRIHGPPDVPTYLAWLAEREIDEGYYPDAREAFLGGDGALEILRKRWREYKVVARETLVSEHAWIRSEQVVLLFLELFMAAPKLKAEVAAWFVEHADYARPILVDLEKAGGVHAAGARKVLKQLDAPGGTAAEKRRKA